MIVTYLTIIICKLISDNDYKKIYIYPFGFEKYRYILINSTCIKSFFQQTNTSTPIYLFVICTMIILFYTYSLLLI